MVNVGSEEPAQIVTKLRQALDAVNRLSSERAALEEALKVRKELPPVEMHRSQAYCLLSSLALRMLRLCCPQCGPMTWCWPLGIQTCSHLSQGERCKSVRCCVQVEKNKDNILPRIMAVSGSYDKLFAEELKKYDPLKVRGSPLMHARVLPSCWLCHSLPAGTLCIPLMQNARTAACCMRPGSLCETSTG